ncbi:hypothetical protein EVAR_35410_1 [Eumeta japonica]|uniref:Uncharacterized protein n=1 Tax=Eumeta variegata TaxID=151549 RepID=A0A4C1X6R0_EUMVA|nr:hypothetical protein EVAR_35410_1 [Eumeta japonica]
MLTYPKTKARTNLNYRAYTKLSLIKAVTPDCYRPSARRRRRGRGITRARARRYIPPLSRRTLATSRLADTVGFDTRHYGPERFIRIATHVIDFR